MWASHTRCQGGRCQGERKIVVMLRKGGAGEWRGVKDGGKGRCRGPCGEGRKGTIGIR